jgi:hypothetical protein
MYRFFVPIFFVFAVACDPIPQAPANDWNLVGWSHQNKDCQDTYDVCFRNLTLERSTDIAALTLVAPNQFQLGILTADVLLDGWHDLDTRVDDLGWTSSPTIALDYTCVLQVEGEVETLTLQHSSGALHQVVWDPSGLCGIQPPAEVIELAEQASDMAYDVEHCMQSDWVDVHGPCA